MQRNFTCAALSALTCMFGNSLIAQPVTTAASIRFGEVYHDYPFTLEDTLTWTLGRSMDFDFTDFGDRELQCFDPPCPWSGPANQVSTDLLESYTYFEVSQSLRDAFDGELPTNIVGLRILDPDYEGEEDNVIVEVRPAGMYIIGRQTIEREDGKLVSTAELDDEPYLFLPLGLKYGEQSDTSEFYLSESSDYTGKFDSIIFTEIIEYAGAGTLGTWAGGTEAVGVWISTYERRTFRANATGNYGEPEVETELDYVYLMSANSAFPRALLDGEYDAVTQTLRIGGIELFLQTSENPSALTSAGIPGATIGVFPNPSSGAFGVDLTLDRSTGLDVELYSAAGQRVSRSAGLTAGPGTTRIPVSDGPLAAGFYLVKLTLADGSHETRRVVVH